MQSIYNWTRTQPSKAAVVYNGSTISYAMFTDAIDATRAFMQEQKLPEGQTAIVVIRNLLDGWVATMALRSIGLDTVSVRCTSQAETLGIKNVACVVTTQAERAEHEVDLNPWPNARTIAIPTPTYEADESGNVAIVARDGKQGGHIIYTSGTTGSYKKLYFSAENMALSSAKRAEALCSDTVYYCGNFGLWTAAGFRLPQPVWHAGGCVVLDDRPDWYKYFLHSDVTCAVFIPSMVGQLLDALNSREPSHSKMDFELIVTAGFLSHQIADQILNRLTSKLINSYSSSETIGPMLRAPVVNLEDLHWLPPAGNRTIDIVDEAGRTCPIGTEGCLRVLLTELDCSSYLDDQEATEKVFRDGYFYPGDMAVLRADGRIRVLGRSADVLNLRGQKIAVAPIEYELQKRLGVETVCLFSGIDQEGQEEVVIAVRADHMPGESELREVSDEFNIFQRVRFAFSREFPLTKTGTQKVDRVKLRKILFPD